MPTILAVHYLSYGRETTAHAITEGTRPARAAVDSKQVPETVPASGRGLATLPTVAETRVDAR